MEISWINGPKNICNFGSCVFFRERRLLVMCARFLALRNSATKHLDTPGATGKAQQHHHVARPGCVGTGELGNPRSRTYAHSTCSGPASSHMCNQYCQSCLFSQLRSWSSDICERARRTPSWENGEPSEVEGRTKVRETGTWDFEGTQLSQLHRKKCQLVWKTENICWTSSILNN